MEPMEREIWVGTLDEGAQHSHYLWKGQQKWYVL
jgi:hypothetical protein